jgi:hypothetical protein
MSELPVSNTTWNRCGGDPTLISPEYPVIDCKPPWGCKGILIPSTHNGRLATNQINIISLSPSLTQERKNEK